MGSLALLSLVSVGFWAFRGWPDTNRSPAPKLSAKAQKKATPAKAKRPPGSAHAVAKRAAVQPSERGADLPTVVPPIPLAGNLDRMTALRADLEEVRLQVAIEQERQKLLPKLPAPVAQPQAQLKLPSPQKPEPIKREPTSPVVVSIQGVDGRSSATIRAVNGKLVTVRSGDRFGGGVIASVGRGGVVIRHGKTSTVLSFE